MKKQLILLTAAAHLLLGVAAQAVDLVVTGDISLGWNRGDPNSGYAHWDFEELYGFPLDTDQFISGTVGYVISTDFNFYPGPGLSVTTETEFGAPVIQFGAEGSGTMTITMPNIVDDFLNKLWLIQIHYTGTAPTLIGGEAHDPVALLFLGGPVLFGTQPLPGIEFLGGQTDTITAPGGLPGEVAIYEGHIMPNPDWETFVFQLPANSELYQVHIDTISIPEPSTVFVVFLGGFGALLRRRRN